MAKYRKGTKSDVAAKKRVVKAKRKTAKKLEMGTKLIRASRASKRAVLDVPAKTTKQIKGKGKIIAAAGTAFMKSTKKQVKRLRDSATMTEKEYLGK